MACAWWLDKAARLCYIDYMSRKNREKRKQARHERFDRVWVAPAWGDAQVSRPTWKPERKWVVTLRADGDVLERLVMYDQSAVRRAFITATYAWGLAPDRYGVGAGVDRRQLRRTAGRWWPMRLPALSLTMPLIDSSLRELWWKQ